MGDAACYLGSTCLNCGKFIGDELAVREECPHCGAGADGLIDDGGLFGPGMSPSAANFILYCKEWPATVEFYRDCLGLEQTYADGWFVEFRLTPSAYVSIADAARATVGSVGGNGVTLSVRVPDVEVLRGRLADRGIATGPILRRFGSQTVDVHDPEGNRIEFWAE